MLHCTVKKEFQSFMMLSLEKHWQQRVRHITAKLLQLCWHSMASLQCRKQTYLKSIRSWSPLDSLDPVDDRLDLWELFFLPCFKWDTARAGTVTAFMIAFPIRLKLGRCFSLLGLLAAESDALLGERDSCLLGAVKSPEERLFLELRGDFFSSFFSLCRDLDFFDVTGIFSLSLIPSPTPLSVPRRLPDWFPSVDSCWAVPLTQILFLGAESAFMGVPWGLA